MFMGEKSTEFLSLKLVLTASPFSFLILILLFRYLGEVPWGNSLCSSTPALSRDIFDPLKLEVPSDISDATPEDAPPTLPRRLASSLMINLFLFEDGVKAP